MNQVMPNLPIEDGLRGGLIKLAAKHASSQEQQTTVVLPLDHLVDFIHHYATKRGREAIEDISQSRNVLVEDDGGVWCEYCHMMLEDSEQECACEIIYKKQLAKLKAQKEQENK